MGVKAAVRYLVLKRLSNNELALAVLKKLAEGESPSRVAAELGLHKDSVRSFVSRVGEKLCGGIKVQTLLRVVLPALDAIQPVVDNDHGVLVCRICGERVYPHNGNGHNVRIAQHAAMESHILRHHPGVVERAVAKVASEAKRILREDKRKRGSFGFNNTFKYS